MNRCSQLGSWLRYFLPYLLYAHTLLFHLVIYWKWFILEWNNRNTSTWICLHYDLLTWRNLVPPLNTKSSRARLHTHTQTPSWLSNRYILHFLRLPIFPTSLSTVSITAGLVFTFFLAHSVWKLLKKSLQLFSLNTQFFARLVFTSIYYIS